VYHQKIGNQFINADSEEEFLFLYNIKIKNQESVVSL